MSPTMIWRLTFCSAARTTRSLAGRLPEPVENGLTAGCGVHGSALRLSAGVEQIELDLQQLFRQVDVVIVRIVKAQHLRPERGELVGAVGTDIIERGLLVYELAARGRWALAARAP